jgi:hypothetical protein
MTVSKDCMLGGMLEAEILMVSSLKGEVLR